jgi:hypothetical protein
LTLLNGMLGWFVVLGSVPVIIHLLNRRRFKIIVWAAMEFLLATIEKNSRRIQMRDIILMVLRALAIVFLALAMARPTLAPGGAAWLGRKGETAAVIVLDNSMSMGHTDGNRTRFDAAKRLARSALESLPKNASAALILMSDIAVGEVPELSHDLVFVGSEVSRAGISDGGTDIVEGVDAARRILSRAQVAAREVCVITDVQRSAWPKPGDGRWTKLLGELNAVRPHINLFLIDAGDGMTANVSVESFQAEDQLIAADSSVAFNVTLRNHGPAPAEDVGVDLYVGAEPGPPRKAESLVVDEIETVHTVRFETRLDRAGDHRIKVQTELDRLAADNSRYLVVPVMDRMRVLVIDGDPAEDDEPFGGESDFLRAALSPFDFEVSERKSLIDAEVTTVYGLGGKNLRDYDAIILANVAELGPGLVKGLKTFVRSEGKGLVVFVGENVAPGRYNELLGAKAGLLPGRLGTGLIEAEEPEGPGFGFGTEALQHPVVSMFAGTDNRPFLASARFRAAMPVVVEETPPAAPGDDRATEDAVQVVARFTGGTPAIVERRVGRGAVLLFASTADKDWTDFPLRPAFLPVVRRAVQHVALGRRAKKAVSVHERIVDFVGLRDANTRVAILDPRGRTRHVPAELSPGGEFAQIEVSDTHSAGFYRLTGSGAPARLSYFAANPPRTESALEAYTEAELRKLYPGLDFRWVAKGEDIRRRLGEARTGREIWPLLLGLAIACLLAEAMLAQRWAPKDK